MVVRVWVKMKVSGDRRFESLVPFTRLIILGAIRDNRCSAMVSWTVGFPFSLVHVESGLRHQATIAGNCLHVPKGKR